MVLYAIRELYSILKDVSENMENVLPQNSSHSTLSIREAETLFNDTHSHTYEIERLRFSPDGSLLASTAEGDTFVLLWDLKSKTFLRKLTFPTRIQDLVFSPDGTYLAIAEAEAVTLWEVTEEHYQERISVHTNQLAFSPGGKELLLIDAQGMISLISSFHHKMTSLFVNGRINASLDLNILL
jgi:WD40 repeat protein